MTSLAKHFGVVTISTLTSRILGLVRDLLIAAFFGAGRVADVFFVAFMIPNFFRRLVSEGALSVTFVPVYTDVLIKQGKEQSLKLANSVLILQTSFVFLLTLAGIIFTPEIMLLFFGGECPPGLLSLSVNLSRIMFPFLMLVSIVSFSMGYLNSHGSFFAPAFAPVLLNTGIISGIIFAGRYFSQPVYGAAVGVIAGGIMQVLLQIPYMIKEGFRLKVSFNFSHPGVARIFSTLLPAVFGIAAYQINAITGNILAAKIAEGSVSYIYYTNRLTELVTGVFIVSMGNVVLPEMSRVRALDDQAAFTAMFLKSVSSVFFLAVPATAGLIAFGLPVVSVFFMRGNFTYADSMMTYSSFAWAGTGMIFVAVTRVVTPVFYTMNDTKTPVFAAAVSVTLNFVLAIVLMDTEMRHSGISLAGSVASLVQSLILVHLIVRKAKIKDFARVLSPLVKSLVSSFLMAIFVYLVSGMINWQSGSIHVRAVFLLLIITGASLMYFLLCLLLRSEEAIYLVRRLRDRVI